MAERISFTPWQRHSPVMVSPFLWLSDGACQACNLNHPDAMPHDVPLSSVTEVTPCPCQTPCGGSGASSSGPLA